MTDLPKHTLANLALLAIVAFETARTGLHSALLQLRPIVRPPDDLRVSSSHGHEYTGLVFLDHNEVLGGVVVRVGRVTTSTAAPPRPVAPPRTDWSLRRSVEVEPDDDDDDDDSTRLPGWAEDARDRGRRW